LSSEQPLQEFPRFSVVLLISGQWGVVDNHCGRIRDIVSKHDTITAAATAAEHRNAHQDARS
jgi:hypothetical protein